MPQANEQDFRVHHLESIIQFNFRAWDTLQKTSGVSAVNQLRQLKANMGILCEITGEQATDVAARLGISVRMWQ
jgi:hypothetical protein